MGRLEELLLGQLSRLEGVINARFDTLERRLDKLEATGAAVRPAVTDL